MVSQEIAQRLDECRSHLTRVHLSLQNEEQFPNRRNFGQPLLQVEPFEFRRLYKEHEVVKVRVLYDF